MPVSTTISADLDVLYAFVNTNKVALGIKRADRKFKGLINDSDLPFLVIRVGPGQWVMQTLTMRRYTRIYRHEVFVKAVSEGLSGFQEAYEKTLPIMQAFGDAYLANLTLGGGIVQIWPEAGMTDTGVAEMTWGNKTFWGFALDVPVVEKYF